MITLDSVAAPVTEQVSLNGNYALVAPYVKLAGVTMPDFSQLSEQLSRLSSEMERARADLETQDVYGTSPDGLVRATLRAGRLVGLTIESSALEQDPVRLANQVLAAVQDGETSSAELLTRRMSPMTEDVKRAMRDLQ